MLDATAVGGQRPCHVSRRRRRHTDLVNGHPLEGEHGHQLGIGADGQPAHLRIKVPVALQRERSGIPFDQVIILCQSLCARRQEGERWGSGGGLGWGG